MKAIVVPFQDIPEKALIIEAKNCRRYRVYQKTSPINATIYGAGVPIPFHSLHKFIIITETSYAELANGSEFALAASAQSPDGFLVPADILLKLETYAHQVDMNYKAPNRDIHIDGNVRVFNLGLTFLFDNVTIAQLNI